MRRSFAMLAATAVVGALIASEPGWAIPRVDDLAPTLGRATAADLPSQLGQGRVGLATQRPAASAGGWVTRKKELPRKGAPIKPPTGPNPYLALLADPATADYPGWRRWLELKSRQRATEQRAQQRGRAPAPAAVDEQEPAGVNGTNDEPRSSQRITGFGTGSGRNSRARVIGELSPDRITPAAVSPNREDDGSIPKAGDTGIKASRAGITTSATIGDGPYGKAGTGTGDFDFYKFEAPAGESVRADIDTPTGELDSILTLYNSAGEMLAVNDDDGEDLDSLLTYEFTTAGTYYAMVTGYAARPQDPANSASGTGAESEGPYTLSLTIGKTDKDYFAVRLRKGDVLGTSVSGAAARITIYDTVPREVHGSEQDSSFVYPADTPLPGGGNAVAEYVAERDGWHTVGVSTGSGRYDITVEAYRPGLAGKRVTQTVFLDFDGARLNTAIFGGGGVRTLSPLSAFLSKWGLTEADEKAVIDKAVATVRENLRQDLIKSGLNDQFALRILNSQNHHDPFGKPRVSRIVVGGTGEQAGVATLGISQSVDPGNFDQEESALILLDQLSAPAGDDTSLNTYLKPASNRIRFVGQALGNVISHEAGHFFGNWHVDQSNDVADLMDQGGNFPLMFGVGRDQVGGTADDTDVDFGEDRFYPGEGFTGIENTKTRLVFSLTH